MSCHRVGLRGGRSRRSRGGPCRNVPMVCWGVRNKKMSEGPRIAERSTTGADVADVVETGWTEQPDRGVAPTTETETTTLRRRGSRVRIPSSALENHWLPEAKNGEKHRTRSVTLTPFWPYRLRRRTSGFTGHCSTFFPRPLNLRRFRSPFLGCWTKAMFCTLRRNPTDRLADLSPARTLVSGCSG